MANKGPVSAASTPSKPPTTAEQERELDEAIEETFPASDPIAVGHETGDEEPHARVERRPPLLDVELVKRLARELKREPKAR
jgi:hypothetical protein